MRRRPINTLSFVSGSLATALAVLLLCTFYLKIPSSWKIKNEGNTTIPTNEDIFADQSYGTAIEAERYRRPEPLRCGPQLTPTTVLQSSKYCSWNADLQDCYQKLEQEMKHTSSWVFLGGPDMSTLADYVSRKWPYQNATVNVSTRRNPCQNLLYYGLPPPRHSWQPPNASLGEGPTGYGLEHPYCADCRNCWNVLLDASVNDTVNNVATPNRRYVEYLVVEYARDVSVQTSITNTTQDTVSYYLRLKQPQVCVVSVGLYDATIANQSNDTFLKNVDRYLSLLQRPCGVVVWLSIPAIVEDESEPQHKNCELQQRNVAIMEMLTEKNFHNVYILDIWEKTLQSDHSGYLQLSNRFYGSLARFIVAFMAGY
jgi:hypothetical protein